MKAPEGAKVYNVWIWLITLLPLVSYISLAFIPWTQLVPADYTDRSSVTANQLSMMSSPWYLLSQALGWIIYAIIVFFAFRDWKWLNEQGVPRPFHWAFAFIPVSIVYVIGRSVVVRRRTGHGIAPMWVSIAIIVFGFIVGSCYLL